jgi:hypothetical protein
MSRNNASAIGLRQVLPVQTKRTRFKAVKCEFLPGGQHAAPEEKVKAARINQGLRIARAAAD